MRLLNVDSTHFSPKEKVCHFNADPSVEGLIIADKSLPKEEELAIIE
jgi:hypothetical protein